MIVRSLGYPFCIRIKQISAKTICPVLGSLHTLYTVYQHTKTDCFGFFYVMGCRMTFAILRATNLCLRGSRKKWRSGTVMDDGAGFLAYVYYVLSVVYQFVCLSTYYVFCTILMTLMYMYMYGSFAFLQFLLLTTVINLNNTRRC